MDQLVEIIAPLTKSEAAKKYNAKSYIKHKVDEKIKCSVCDGKYSYYNKSHHKQSKKHKDAAEILATSTTQ